MELVYEPVCEELLEDCVRHMLILAEEHEQACKAVFNDIEIVAHSGDDPAAILKRYSEESNRRAEAWVNSPEYAESQRQAEERARRQKLILDGALMTAPERMTLRDDQAEQLWKEVLEKSKDAYRGGINSYAERWARLMEARIANGDTVAGCAQEASLVAGKEGISGFMYGSAVSILARLWIHGEELRRWHNLETQPGEEGEKANESGGVLNPALLIVSVR